MILAGNGLRFSSGCRLICTAKCRTYQGMATLARKLPIAALARERPTARLEARIPATLKETLEAAASLKGHASVTAYIIQTLQENASRVVQESRHSQLEAAESIAFVQSLLAPAA